MAWRKELEFKREEVNYKKHSIDGILDIHLQRGVNIESANIEYGGMLDCLGRHSHKCTITLELDITEHLVTQEVGNCWFADKCGLEPNIIDEMCEGLQKSQFDDEPCEVCKDCNVHYYNEE